MTTPKTEGAATPVRDWAHALAREMDVPVSAVLTCTASYVFINQDRARAFERLFREYVGNGLAWDPRDAQRFGIMDVEVRR